MANFQHIKAWLNKKTIDKHSEDYVTSSDGPDGTKRGIDTNVLFSPKFLTEVRKGNVPGHQLINKFGATAAVGINFGPVASGNVYQTPSTLTSLEVLSTDNANDIPGGTGALTIKVWGVNNINGLWTEDTETVALNGTTVVPLTKQFFRIYKMRVMTSGAYADATTPSHNSTITLRTAGAGATWAIIDTEDNFGLGSTEIGAYSIPKGMTAHLLNMHIDIEATKIVDLVGFIREDADTVVAPFSAMNAFLIKRGMEGEHEAGNSAGLATIVGPADVGFMVKQSGGTSKAEVEFTLLCIED